MVWRRLPTFFPNFPLRMMPLSEAQAAQIRETGWVREAAFRTEPHVNKVEIKRFLEAVYGARVESVHTLNYEGKKKRRLDAKTGRPRWVRLPDWKKAYVVFRNGQEAGGSVPEAQGPGPAAAGAGATGARAEAGARAATQGGGQGGEWWRGRRLGSSGAGFPGRLAGAGGWPAARPATAASIAAGGAAAPPLAGARTL